MLRHREAQKSALVGKIDRKVIYNIKIKKMKGLLINFELLISFQAFYL